MRFLLVKVGFNLKKEIKKFVFLLLFIYINLAGINAAVASISNWEEIRSSEINQQWWDRTTLHRTKHDSVTVMTRFKSNDVKDNHRAKEIYYFMEIDCQKKLYKDKVINGIPNLQANWSSPKGDKLIKTLITNVCQQEVL